MESLSAPLPSLCPSHSFPLLPISLSFRSLSKLHGLHLPTIGLFCPPVVTALQVTMLHTTPMATHLHGTSSGGRTDAPQPCIIFAPTLVQGSLATQMISLAENLDSWCTDADAREGVGCVFADVIAHKQWCAECWAEAQVQPELSTCQPGPGSTFL